MEVSGYRVRVSVYGGESGGEWVWGESEWVWG